MGTLTPGATYIYEHADGVTYAREFGKTQRVVVGYNESYYKRRRHQLWQNIIEVSFEDKELEHMLEQVEIYYRLRHQDTP